MAVAFAHRSTMVQTCLKQGTGAHFDTLGALVDFLSKMFANFLRSAEKGL
jgi:hypothetical protein